MPGAQYKRALPGQRLSGNITAEAWNRMLGLTERGEDFTGDPSFATVRQSGVVLVKNSSGSVKAEFAVLGLDGPIVTPTQKEAEFKRQVTFSGITPTTASHTSKFCVLLEPLGINAIGMAVVSGVVQVRLTGADVGWATVTNNDATKLTASATGTAEVLWAEAGSAERWAKVVLHSRSGGSSASYARITRTTDQTISAVGNTAITFTTEVSDTGGYWSSGANFDVPAGVWDFTANLVVTGVAGDLAGFWIGGAGGSSSANYTAITSLYWSANGVRQASMSTGPLLTTAGSTSVGITGSGNAVTVNNANFSVKRLG